MPRNDVFDLLADMTNTADWDPGVVEAVQTSGSGGGPDAAWDVSVKTPGGSSVFGYETLHYERPERLILQADTRWFKSVDEIVVTSVDGETEVLYDAELVFGSIGFVSKVTDPILQRAFHRIGEEATEGLLQAIDGRRVESP